MSVSLRPIAPARSRPPAGSGGASRRWRAPWPPLACLALAVALWLVAADLGDRRR